jgi:hypothetical protein
MTPHDIVALALSHGLTYLLTSDFPLDTVEDPVLRELLLQAQSALTPLVQYLYEKQGEL